MPGFVILNKRKCMAARDAEMSTLYLKEISKLPLKTHSEILLSCEKVSNFCWFQSVVTLPGVRVAWDAKCSSAYAESKISCSLFRLRWSEVTLDFKQYFQTKLGFCPGTLCTVPSMPSLHGTWRLSLCLVTSHLFVLPSWLWVLSFNRDLTLSLRSLTVLHSKFDLQVLFFSALTFNSNHHLHNYQKAEVQHVAKIPFTFNLFILLMCSIYSSGTEDSCQPFTWKFG